MAGFDGSWLRRSELAAFPFLISSPSSLHPSTPICTFRLSFLNMSSSDPPPPPTRLPYDILALIVAETVHDPPSLASWSLVSFAMLELAAPLLYEKIELKGDQDYQCLSKDPVSGDLSDQEGH